MDDQKELEWDCVIPREQLRPQIVRRRDQLADAARDGRWRDVLSLLDDTDFFFHHAITANSSRVGGRSGFGPLHQAAHHGARDAAEGLVDRGPGSRCATIRVRRGRMSLAVMVATFWHDGSNRRRFPATWWISRPGSAH